MYENVKRERRGNAERNERQGRREKTEITRSLYLCGPPENFVQTN